jgi:hypothetical protein
MSTSTSVGRRRPPQSADIPVPASTPSARRPGPDGHGEVPAPRQATRDRPAKRQVPPEQLTLW